jgi:hypothetical protein
LFARSLKHQFDLNAMSLEEDEIQGYIVDRVTLRYETW